MKKLLLILQTIAMLTGIHAITISVALDGSQPYASIQSAIEAANNGDTVLVYPGRYFENVDFIGKSITVCSLEATTSDSTYISSTIIDGNNSGSCVRFLNQEQGASLRGFTLEHGTGYPYGADNALKGGGIHVRANSNVSIINCDVRNNHSSEAGGVFISKGTVSLSGVDIHDNYATSMTGGVYVYSHTSSPASITFDPINRCSIYNNYSSNPCDIAIIDVMANLDIYLDMTSVAQLTNFYYNRFNNFQYTQEYHDTIYSQRAYRVEVNHDLYISTTGNDNNSGLSPAEAMKSITKAVHRIASDSLATKTVHVLPGTYREEDGDQIFPIPCKSYVKIIGAGSEGCTLFTTKTYESKIQYVFSAIRLKKIAFIGFRISIPTDQNRRMYPVNIIADDLVLSDITISDTNVYQWGAIQLYYLNNAKIEHITLRNIQTSCVIFTGNKVSGSITNCVFENISSTTVAPDGWASTMFDLWARGTLRVENCVFRNFSVPDMQPTLHISDPNQPTGDVNIAVTNCIFDNLQTDNESPVGFNNRNVENFQVNNCTFINNRGATGAVGLTGWIYMQNNIFYNPSSANEIHLYLSAPYGIDSNVYLDYNNIRGGESAVYNPFSNNHVYYGDTNISSDPSFASLTPGDALYARLSESSPCINSGTLDTAGLNLLPFDLAGNFRIWDGRIDMGCYEYGSEPWVANDDPFVTELPGIIAATNYPNPFNPTTTIAFSLPLAGRTTLDVYNFKGQRIRTLVDNCLPTGKHTAVWDGKTDVGSSVSSGIYFYRIASGTHNYTGKMILAK